MSKFEELLNGTKTCQDRDNVIRKEYLRLNDEKSADRDSLVTGFVRGLLSRMVHIGQEHGNKLHIIDNKITNYDLHRLSINDKTALPDSLRAARFNNGLFYSIRIRQESDTIIQHDLSFYNSYTDYLLPRLMTRVLRDYGQGQIAKSFLPPKFPLEYTELYDEPIPSIVMDAHMLLDREASSSPPWQNAYKTSELVSVRNRVSIRKVSQDEIRINPMLNQPYL